MVDFTGLLEKEEAPDASDILSYFETLDRKTSHIELRPSQTAAIKALTDIREQKDCILKLSTGAGKTTIGLLYLASHMHEKKEPVVFFCPTKQLCEQTLSEANKLGINAYIYPARQSHPHHECLSADAICICTYEKLFNARTTFDRKDVMLRPCAVVLDDAHAGLESIRDAFTLHVTAGSLYDELFKKLDPICSEYKPAIWVQIKEGNPHQSIEIPYWKWKAIDADLLPVLAQYAEKDGYMFVIPLLLETLKWCRCVISIHGIEIVPQVLPVERFTAFSMARHRLFMSATLADDSILVRDLHCEPLAAENAIIPETDRGMGERMVIAPSLIDPDCNREWVMGLCQSLSVSHNIVVLSASQRRGADWEEYGAKVYLSDEINDAVSRLRNNKSGNNFVVLTQRYDGVDLPDDACRILVIDGLPVGEGIIDAHDTSLNTHSSGVCQRIVYRIEQGMGRAVRSHADYAVVLLAGGDIASYIAQIGVQKAMNPETSAQLRLAIELAKYASEEANANIAIRSLMRQCLQRDDGWKKYYNQRVRDADIKGSPAASKESLILAAAERKAYTAAVANDPSLSVNHLREALDQCDVDERLHGGYLQTIASYSFETSPTEAYKIQAAAFEKNRDTFCPPIATKNIFSKTAPVGLDRMLGWLSEFADQTGALVLINDLSSKLNFDQSVTQFEEELKKLAIPLGAEGSRPEKEYGEGPDCLWLWGDHAFVIEAKTEKEKLLYKKDAEQLLHSVEWFKAKNPDTYSIIPITVSKVTIADTGVHYPKEASVLTPEGILTLIGNIYSFYKEVVDLPLLAASKKELSRKLAQLNLTPETFVNTYCEKIRTK